MSHSAISQSSISWGALTHTALDKSTACSLFSPAYTACTPPLRSAVNQVHNLKDTHCTTSIISKPTLNRGTFLLLYKIRFKKKIEKRIPQQGFKAANKKQNRWSKRNSISTKKAMQNEQIDSDPQSQDTNWTTTPNKRK